MFLAEKGLPFERVEVDIAAGATAQADFLAINPLGEVPILELDDGTRLTESLAICRYLESLHPQPPLLGASPLEGAQIESMVLMVMFRLYVPTTHAFRHTHKFWQGRLAQVPEYGEIARRQVLDEWQRLDAHLGHSTYMAGERFSFADIVAFTTLEFGKVAGIRVQPGQSRLAHWRDSIAARPSASA
jgi:glutathione S-transferase